jgi:hypothetical protein
MVVLMAVRRPRGAQLSGWRGSPQRHVDRRIGSKGAKSVKEAVSALRIGCGVCVGFVAWRCGRRVRDAQKKGAGLVIGDRRVVAVAGLKTKSPESAMEKT